MIADYLEPTLQEGQKFFPTAGGKLGGSGPHCKLLSCSFWPPPTSAQETGPLVNQHLQRVDGSGHLPPGSKWWRRPGSFPCPGAIPANSSYSSKYCHHGGNATSSYHQLEARWLKASLSALPCKITLSRRPGQMIECVTF